MLQTVLVCAFAAFVGTAVGKLTWARLRRRDVPSIGDCVAYGLSNAYAAAWSSALALVLYRPCALNL